MLLFGIKARYDDGTEAWVMVPVERERDAFIAGHTWCENWPDYETAEEAYERWREVQEREAESCMANPRMTNTTKSNTSATSNARHQDHP